MNIWTWVRECNAYINMKGSLLFTIFLFIPSVHTLTVNLYNHTLARVPQNITMDVTILHLDLNNILHLSDCCFCNYPQLEELYLQQNGLEIVSETAFANNSRLYRLQLAYNRIIFFPSFLLGAGESLTKIDLRVEDGAAVTLTNLSFLNYPNLEYISLMHNHISSGVLHMFNLPSLTSLFAKDCGLIVFPDLSAATQLEQFQLTNNKFNSVPPQSIYGLTKLNRFSVANSGITQLPNNMQHLVALESLVLHQNKLSTLPDLFNLSLTYILLNRNPVLCDQSLCWLRMWCFMKPPPTGFDSTLLKCASPESLRDSILMTVNPADMECYKGNRMCHPQ